MRLSNAIIVVRGGIGTLLELYFSWQLLQVGHMPDRPIILMDKKFWQGLLDWMKEAQAGNGLISPGDFRWLKLVDTPEEALDVIRDHYGEFLEGQEKNAEIVSKVQEKNSPKAKA